MAMRLVRNEGDAPLPPIGGVTSEQRAQYEEAHRIFGDSGANRTGAPGQPVDSNERTRLNKARLASAIGKQALRMAERLAPEFRDEWLRKHGLDPSAFPSEPDSSAESPMKLTTDEE